jgi:hypothetical protein
VLEVNLIETPVTSVAGVFYLQKESTMPSITINNQSYDLETLTDDAKAQLQSLQFVDAELSRRQAQTAVLKTARLAYAKALQAALPSVLEQAQASETLKFN